MARDRGEYGSLPSLLFSSCMDCLSGFLQRLRGQGAGKASFVSYLHELGLFGSSDLRRDVYQNVSVAHTVCSAVPDAAFKGGAGSGLYLWAFSASRRDHGISGISDAVLLCDLPFFPGGSLFTFSSFPKKMEGTDFLCAFLWGGISAGDPLLSCKSVAHFQRVSGDGGRVGICRCVQHPGTDPFFLWTV